MFLTELLLKTKAGWVPRSFKVPGRQTIGKHRKLIIQTKAMRRTERKMRKRVADNEQMIAFSYLNEVEELQPEKDHQMEQDALRQAWQQRKIGHDVFGLGLGKPSMLDYIMEGDKRRYGEVKIGALSDSKLYDHGNHLIENNENNIETGIETEKPNNWLLEKLNEIAKIAKIK